MGFERQDSFIRMVGERVQIARKEAKLTQEALSDKLGFKDRQILSNIESGKRKVSTDEMLALMKHLGKTLEYFTDPLILVAEGAFCWRANAGPDVLDAFEEKAKGWIALYRTLGYDLNEPVNPLFPQLAITTRNSFEDAQSAAEQLIGQWDLGEIPSGKIAESVEDRLGVLVLFVEAPRTISGAASHLRDLNAILINRHDHDGRRIYDFAHELFHLLTWQTMPPERIDGETAKKPSGRRIEQLANAFAAALLMPGKVVESGWKRDSEKVKDVHDRINRLADRFGVTALALKLRLENMGLLSDRDKLTMVDSRLTWNGRAPTDRNLPPLFSRSFVARLQKALKRGYLSVRRSARILDCTVEDVADLIADYGFESPY
ncbi:MAG: hypothetical protein A2Z34_01120 [Planctomycetes bacterium RBG_16_59_8]|nr:MAG: hypothetical protein A2Z34_01120 [Planctomycetes bacterium RBG_16_59_8]